MLGKLADLIEQHTEEFAALESLNVGMSRTRSVTFRVLIRTTGKPYFASKYFEIGSTVAGIRYYAGWADKIQGKTMEVCRMSCRFCLGL